jgi:hypothetical protein
MQIGNDLLKPITVARGLVIVMVGSIQRYAQFIQAGVDEVILAIFIQQNSIGIKKNKRIAIFQMANHGRQVRIQQGLTDTVEGNAFQLRQLIGYPHQLLKGHITCRFPASPVQNAGPAFEVTAIGDLNIQIARQLQLRVSNSHIVFNPNFAPDEQFRFITRFEILEIWII